MEKQEGYPFAEVEARWSASAAAGPEAAGARGGAPPGTAYPWPGVGGEGLEGLSLLRAWVLADTYARVARATGEPLRAPRVADTFSERVVALAERQRLTYQAAADRDVATLRKLSERLGLAGGAEVLEVSDPSYYRFTQWIFLQLYLRGAVKREVRRVESCARCSRVYPRGALAACPACQGELMARDEARWELDLGLHGERLHQELERSGLPSSFIAEQRGLLGRLRGSELTFPASRMFSEEYVEITGFTTAIEQVFGVTFILLDPYHPVLEHVLDPAYQDDLERYRERLRKGAEPRISAQRTGGFALNPANLRRIPILVSPLACGPYREGVVFAVPAHDAELFELARRQKLPIREVIHNDAARFDSSSRLEEPWIGDGVLTNSGSFTSLASRVGREKIIAFLAKRGVCQRATRFRWNRLPLGSRNGWGPPIPMVHCKRCGVVPVPEGELPLELPPDLGQAAPAAARPPARGPAGSSAPPVPPTPLDEIRSFVRTVCPVCKEGASRETETIAPWLGRAWSLLRIALPGLSGHCDGFRDLNAPPSPVAPVEDSPAEPPSYDGSREAADLDRASAGAAPEPEEAEEDDDPSGEDDLEDELGDEEDEDLDPESELEPADSDSDGGDGGDEDMDAGEEDEPGGEEDEGDDENGEDGDSDLDGEDADLDEEALDDLRASGASESPVGQADGPTSRGDEEAGSGEGAPGGGLPPKAVLERAPPAGERPRGGAPGADRATTSPGGAASTAGGPPDEGKGGRRGKRGGDAGRRTDEPEDITRDAEEAQESPLEHLSALRPFRGARPAPIGTVLGARELGPAEWIGARAITKFLEEAGHVELSEPFARFRAVGSVRIRPAPAGVKRPLARSVAELLDRYGGDALRLALLFAGPIDRDVTIGERDVARMARFVARIWRQVNLRRERGRFISKKMLLSKHFLIHNVTRRTSEWKLHTAVASFQGFVRFLENPETSPEDLDRGGLRTFLILLQPFTPFLVRELWHRLGETEPLENARWPIPSDEMVHPHERELLIYVDARLVDRMVQPVHLEPEKLESRALARDKVREAIGQRRVSRAIVVPQKLVSIVLEDA